MTNETDRIQNAIRHIQTAVDVDPWAKEIAVSAMEKQVPKVVVDEEDDYAQCPNCGNELFYHKKGWCKWCGQKYVWTEGEG